MSGGRTAPKATLVGWVFLDCHRLEGFTIRWQRGAPVAYVLDGRRIGDHATVAGVLATIPVTPAGWTDLTDLRLLGQRWLRQQ